MDRDAFMRYQYGMSVGHKYTHTSAFPPSLPSIPPGFDHCVSEIDAEVEVRRCLHDLRGDSDLTRLTSGKRL